MLNLKGLCIEHILLRLALVFAYLYGNLKFKYISSKALRCENSKTTGIKHFVSLKSGLFLFILFSDTTIQDPCGEPVVGSKNQMRSKN